MSRSPSRSAEIDEAQFAVVHARTVASNSAASVAGVVEADHFARRARRPAARRPPRSTRGWRRPSRPARRCRRRVGGWPRRRSGRRTTAPRRAVTVGLIDGASGEDVEAADEHRVQRASQHEHLGTARRRGRASPWRRRETGGVVMLATSQSPLHHSLPSTRPRPVNVRGSAPSTGLSSHQVRVDRAAAGGRSVARRRWCRRCRGPYVAMITCGETGVAPDEQRTRRASRTGGRRRRSPIASVTKPGTTATAPARAEAGRRPPPAGRSPRASCSLQPAPHPRCPARLTSQPPTS